MMVPRPPAENHQGSADRFPVGWSQQYCFQYRTIRGDRMGLSCATLASRAEHRICRFPSCSLFVYRKLVFRVKGHFWLDLGRFTLVNLTMFFTNMALLLVAHEILGYPKIPAQIAITFVTVFINYFGHKYFSFRRRPEPASPHKTPRKVHHESQSLHRHSGLQ